MRKPKNTKIYDLASVGNCVFDNRMNNFNLQILVKILLASKVLFQPLHLKIKWKFEI